MSNYSPIHFCYERDRERLGSTQCGNDEFLRMLDYFVMTLFYGMTAETRVLVNSFVENFLYFFCHPGFFFLLHRTGRNIFFYLHDDRRFDIGNRQNR